MVEEETVAGEKTEAEEGIEENPVKEVMTTAPLEEGDYVIVTYEEEYFPGEIKKIQANKAYICTMKISGLNIWKWPKVADEIWYDFEEVIQKIPPPREINNRVYFSVK